MKPSGRTLFSAVILLVFFSYCAASTSFGVGPSSIRFTLTRGGQINQTLSASTDSDEIVYCDLSSYGDVKDWVSFQKNVIALNPKSQEDFKTQISVPKDTPNGNYSGSILVSSTTNDSNSGYTGISIRPSIRVKTNVEVVGTENRNYNITNVRAPGTVSNGTPMSVEVTIRNNGNIWIRPAIYVRIRDAKGVQRYESNNTILMHPPSEKTVSFSLPTEGLEGGQYSIIVDAPWRDENLGPRTQKFTVVLEGASAQGTNVSGELISLSLGEKEISAGDVVGITGLFKNTCETPVSAKLVLGVLHNRIYKDIESESKVINPGEETELTAYYTPTDYGLYEVEGYVVGPEFKTENQKTDFIVHTNAEEGNNMNLLPYAVAGVLVVLVILLVITRTKKNKSSPQPENSPPQQDNSSPQPANGVNNPSGAPENNNEGQHVN